MAGKFNPFGKANVEQLLKSVREAVLTERGCEEFYDKARSIVLLLTRSRSCDQEELTWCRQCLTRAAAYASGSDATYAKVLKARLEVLTNILDDQRMFTAHYTRESLASMPHYREVLDFLHLNGTIQIFIVMGVLKLHPDAIGLIEVLCSAGLAMHHYPRGDEPYLSLTADGVAYHKEITAA